MLFGDYQFYELLQEGAEETEDTYVEAEAPNIHINYEMKFNPKNKQKRKIASAVCFGVGTTIYGTSSFFLCVWYNKYIQILYGGNIYASRLYDDF